MLLIAMLRLGEVFIRFSFVTGAGNKGDGGGELYNFFSLSASLVDGGGADDVESVDETERLVLRRSRMAAKYWKTSISPLDQMFRCKPASSTKVLDNDPSSSSNSSWAVIRSAYEK